VYASKRSNLVPHNWPFFAFHMKLSTSTKKNSTQANQPARSPPPGEPFVGKCAPFAYWCLYVWIFGVCLEPALQWPVSQWRGVSLPLDCCLTSRQTEHIGSGWTETPTGRNRGRGRGREGEGERMQGEKWAEREIKDGSQRIRQLHFIYEL